MENIAKPTKQQLDWHELELGVLIHYCLEMYRPELPGEWQRIRAFRILADGKPVYERECIGHKRIVPFDCLTAAGLVIEITNAVGRPILRDVAVY